MKKFFVAAAVAAVTVASQASATVVTQFDGVAAGRASFNSTVTGTGATVANSLWNGAMGGTTVDFGSYTLTRNDGGYVGFQNYGTLSGDVVSIDPRASENETNGRLNPMKYFGSGVTLTFDHDVNAVGFEVGDWATCCTNPTTDLFISFDDGTPIRVATAKIGTEGEFPSQADPNSIVNEIFVGATDDSGKFRKVSFWGNGLGEYLVFGGEVRYALVDQGSLPTVPLPASALLLMAGVGMLGAARKRKA